MILLPIFLGLISCVIGKVQELDSLWGFDLHTDNTLSMVNDEIKADADNDITAPVIELKECSYGLSPVGTMGNYILYEDCEEPCQCYCSKYRAIDMRFEGKYLCYDKVVDGEENREKVAHKVEGITCVCGISHENSNGEAVESWCPGGYSNVRMNENACVRDICAGVRFYFVGDHLTGCTSRTLSDNEEVRGVCTPTLRRGNDSLYHCRCLGLNAMNENGELNPLPEAEANNGLTFLKNYHPSLFERIRLDL